MSWAYWSEERSRIREIDAADLDGDQRPEILLSNSDRRVYAFSPDGKELWKTPIEWGVFTAMTVGRYQGEWALMGGTSIPSIHGRAIVLGADGKLRAHLQRPDVVSWSVPSSFLDMQLADVDGDGNREILTALDTNCRQLLVYDSGGRLKWDADMAGAAIALAVDSPRNRVICASAAGYVVALDGRTGTRKWSRRLGDVPHQVWIDEEGSAVAACRSGQVFAIDRRGELLGRDDLQTPITALLRPGDHRAAGTPLVVGTADGRVLLLDGPVRPAP
jgi:outer membrane protein assembly factor BamB